MDLAESILLLIEKVRSEMKNKTMDYILGFITGIAVSLALYSCTSPLNADDVYSTRGNSEFYPLYVKVVE